MTAQPLVPEDVITEEQRAAMDRAFTAAGWAMPRHVRLWRVLACDYTHLARLDGEHLALFPEAVTTAIALCSTVGDHALAMLAEHPNTSGAALETLSRHPNLNIRRNVADRAALPANVARLLAYDVAGHVRVALAWRSDVRDDPADVVDALARDGLLSVRASLAARTRNVEALALLVHSGDATVRHAVSGNPRTPAEALALLASDDYANIRERVAAHASTTPTTLERLARDVDAGVRLHVANHPHTPHDVRRELADRDLSADVRDVAAAALSREDRTVRDPQE
jgi:hypothetical protein